MAETEGGKGISAPEGTQHTAPQPAAAELNHEARSDRLDWVAREIAGRAAFIEAKSVLEFGGGDFSRISGLALAFPGKVFCSMDFDYSKGATGNVAKYAGLKNLNLVKADARSNPFRDEVFDFAFSVAVGEHIAELPLFLEETYRVLKPGGEYYFREAPFWTSVRGHHFLHWRPDVLDVLGGYEHLILSAEEMRAYLRSRENLPFDVEVCVNRIYRRADLSRLSERETKLIIERSKFIVDTWFIQDDELYDQQKAKTVLRKCGKYAVDDLKIKGVVAVLRKPPEAGALLRASEHPLLHGLGQTLLGPIRKLTRIVVLATYRLLGKTPDGLRRVILKVAGENRISRFTKPLAEAASLYSIQRNQRRPVLVRNRASRYRHCIRIAVYADANMNIIDGSSIWTASLVETLANSQHTDVFFFLKSRERRRLLTAPLKRFGAVTIIRPSINAIRHNLTSEAALNEIKDVDRQQDFNAIVLRGLSLCEKASLRASLHGRLWTYLTDIPQKSEDVTEEVRQKLDRIARASKYVLCQTEEFCSYWEKHVPSARGKTRLLPPIVPEVQKRREAPSAVKRICYAGKFAPLWGILELFDAFASVRAIDPEIELHVFGDKVHNPPELPDFRNTVLSRLENTAGLVWHRGISREEVLNRMANMDLGWAWRSPGLEDNTLELSTKILEYGICGLPVILYRNKINERLLGPEYPLFANTYDEVVELLRRLVTSPGLLAAASDKTHAAGEQFAMGKVRDQYIRPLLTDLVAPGVLDRPTGRGSILVNGHDLKFVNGLCEKFSERGYDIAVDKWDGHNGHDAGRSRELLGKADIIISEWCLGNAVWYSRNKRPGQRHIVRFHLQERNLNYPANVDMRNVDTMIFVGPHIMREAVARFGWERWAKDKLVVIPNYVDATTLDLPKLAGAEFNIGIVGIVPQRKRLDLAVDIIEKLRSQDERFHLYVKGKMPREYRWMLTKPGELRYYRRQTQRIKRSALLKAGIRFDGWGDDMPQWYQKIGFILSVSDFESFHLSIAEGAASRAIPLSLKWEGAEEVYPADWSYRTVDDIARVILDIIESGRFREVAEARYAYAKQNFDIERIARLWLEIIGGCHDST
jgi:glycosyltransferase involved in cell wall biosynthesis/SAM-dependent methyltransferase